MIRRRHLLQFCALAPLPILDAGADSTLPKLSLEIAEGNAATTLAEFIRQTGFQVLFETDAIRGHTTRAVRGQLDAAEALRVMLEGSGLVFELINERTVAVRPERVVRL